jgi:hypothetical protein
VIASIERLSRARAARGRSGDASCDAASDRAKTYQRWSPIADDAQRERGPLPADAS